MKYCYITMTSLSDIPTQFTPNFKLCWKFAYDKRVNRYPQSFRAAIQMKIGKLTTLDGIFDKEAFYLVTILWNFSRNFVYRFYIEN